MTLPTFLDSEAGWGQFVDLVIAQAVSRWFSTAAARFRAQLKSSGICGGQSGTGAGFLRVLRFPLPILIPPTVPHSSSSIIRCWYHRPNSGWRTKWTHPTPGNYQGNYRQTNGNMAASDKEIAISEPCKVSQRAWLAGKCFLNPIKLRFIDVS
jgi:hypothetical protein